MLRRKAYTPEQLKLEKIINSLGLETILEKQYGPYFVDIGLPELPKKVIEYDSKVHQLMKKHDAAKDSYLKDNYDIDVLRVTDLRNSEELVKLLKEFLEIE